MTTDYTKCMYKYNAIHTNNNTKEITTKKTNEMTILLQHKLQRELQQVYK